MPKGVRIMFIPLCPNCNRKMEIHRSMMGLQWYCPDYAYCGGRISKVDKEIRMKINNEN